MYILIKTCSNRIVVTLDVIGSKKRGEFTSLIREKVQNIDNSFFEFPLSVSRGDELQGVLLPDTDFAKAFRFIRYELLPFKLRMGIGLGRIEIPDGSLNSWDLSGEAFFYARDCVEELERVKETALCFSSSYEELNSCVNTILGLMNVIMNDWTETQFKYVQLYEEYGTFDNVSEVLGMSSQNIHKACKRANWDVVKKAEENLNGILKRWTGDKK